MDGWSETQQMIVYKDKLLKKSSNQKSKFVSSTVVTMSFKHRISFATDLTANCGCYRFRIMPDIGVSKLLPSAVAVLIDLNKFRLSAVAVCYVSIAWSCENVETWMSLWRT